MNQASEAEQRCMYCGKTPETHPDWGHTAKYLPEPGNLPRWAGFRHYDGAVVTRRSTVVIKPVQRG